MSNIYLHNPRCSKSRQGIEVLDKNGIDYEVREYLKKPLKQKEAEKLYVLLTKNYDLKEFTRYKEKTFKEQSLSLENMTKAKWVSMVTKNPVLIERPILFSANKAIIGRPPEELKQFK